MILMPVSPRIRWTTTTGMPTAMSALARTLVVDATVLLELLDILVLTIHA